MEIKLLDKFKTLPNELINMIINYTDKLVYRNGKYISRGRKYDIKYSMLYNIPIPIKIGFNKVLLKLFNYKYQNMQGYLIEYTYGNEVIKMNIKFFVREIDGFDRYFNIKSYKQMIFDANSKWSKIIEYDM